MAAGGLAKTAGQAGAGLGMHVLGGVNTQSRLFERATTF